MPVLINFKICDKSKDCSGIEACPTNALYWDEENKTIGIDNSKCIDCEKCEKACPVGAIKVAKTEEEYNKIKKENDDDPRGTSELFVDRYGAEPIDPAYWIDLDKFNTQILESGELIAVELFNESSIMCLIKTIPIKDLIKDIKYKKIEIREDTQLLKKYEIANLPALLFFKNGKLLGKIEDHYTPEKKEELKEKIDEIIVDVVTK